ncbi:MAG: hypothetical protein Q3X01_04050, partial [Agathobaculum sp.]|nr:hypothetical protein [Agathobaculum sp.]
LHILQSICFSIDYSACLSQITPDRRCNLGQLMIYSKFWPSNRFPGGFPNALKNTKKPLISYEISG